MKSQGSEFMIAGGPQLVKNDRVGISVNTASRLANARTSRTAVDMDSMRGKAFFITTDGKNKTNTTPADGLTIPEMAQLMKNIGADSALNLDGDGSTTMVVQPQNKNTLEVINNFQNKAERRVSGILMAADTEPKRIFSNVSDRDDPFQGHPIGERARKTSTYSRTTS